MAVPSTDSRLIISVKVGLKAAQHKIVNNSPSNSNQQEPGKIQQPSLTSRGIVIIKDSTVTQ